MSGNTSVLFVDDDVAVRSAFERVATSSGFKVDVADGFASASSLARTNQYAVVVTDYRLADKDGLQVLEAMRKLQPHASYIMISAYYEPSMAMAAVNKHKICRMLPKPWSAPELSEALEHAVNVHWDVIARQKVQNNLLQATHEINKHRQRLDEAWKLGQQQLSEAFLSAFAMRGHETVAHCRRLAAMARLLAQTMGVNGDDLQNIEHGALLHDIGTLAVPDSILLKAGPLTPEEWKIMHQHAQVGAELVVPLPYLRNTQHIIRQHHERWDGKGYPNKMAGEAVCLGARIVSVCDALEAMLSGRAYRRAEEVKLGVAQVQQMAGSQFDPGVVKAFTSIPAAKWVEIRNEFPEVATATRLASVPSTKA